MERREGVAILLLRKNVKKENEMTEVVIQAEMTEEQLEVLVSEIQRVSEMIGINLFEYHIGIKNEDRKN